MTPVTDPAILKQLNGGVAGLSPVTDQAILAQLNGTQEPAQGGLTGALEHKPGWTYGSVLPLARGPEGGLHMSLPDMIREPILSALKSGNKIEHGEVPQVNDYMPAVLATVGAGIRAPATATAKAAPETIASAFGPKTTAPEQKAAQLVTRAFQRDKVDPANAAQVMERYPDKNIAVMDAGGKNVQRLARTVNTLPGEGSEQVGKFLSERQADQHGRVLNDIAANLSDGSNLYKQADDLIAERSKSAGPLFEAAYAKGRPSWSPRLQQFLDDPVTAQAAREGVKIQRLDALAKGKPFKPTDYSFSFDESGEPIISWAGKGDKDVPNLRTLQSVKEGLDAMVEQYRDTTTGKLVLTKHGKALNDVRAAFRDELKRVAPPEYGQALDAWAGPSQSKDAIEAGQSFMTLPPEILAKRMSGLKDAEKDFFRIGAARSLQDRVNNAADNADAVSRVFGNATTRKRIEAVFGKGAADKFAEAAGAEKMATATDRMVRGGSNTADKLADVADTNTIGRDAAHGFVTGGLKGAIALPALNYAHSKIDAYFHGMTPEVRAALADLLQRTGPSALSDLGRANLPPRRLNNGSAPKALSGTALSAFLTPPAEANRQRR